MVKITDTAAVELKSLLESEEKKDYSLRIFVAGMGCSGIQYGMSLDTEVKEDDVTIETKDIKIVMSSDIVGTLAEASIDYIDNSYGKGFVINNPKAASSCGSCGGSCH